MISIHPSMPVQFEGLNKSPLNQSCNDKSICRPCPWHCDDTIRFQIAVPHNYTADLDAELLDDDGVVTGTEVVGPGTLDSTSADGTTDYLNFAVPLAGWCSEDHVRLSLTVTPPGGIIVASTYKSLELNISSDLDDLCCSYEVRFWSDCKLSDETDVIYENGYKTTLRMCGDLTSLGRQDVIRGGVMLPSGPKLCAVRTRETWQFKAEATTDERHLTLGYIWIHPYIEFRKFGEPDWYRFKPLDGGWVKGRQLVRSVNVWEGSGQLTRDSQTASVACC